jgi:hypothetical protein
MAGSKGLYRVWFKNLCGQDKSNRWNEDTVKEVAEALKGLFAKVVANPACPYSSVDVFPFHNGALMDPGEVLVQFVASRRFRLVRRFSGQEPSDTAGGASWPHPTGVLSEVWIKVMFRLCSIVAPLPIVSPSRQCLVEQLGGNVRAARPSCPSP